MLALGLVPMVVPMLTTPTLEEIDNGGNRPFVLIDKAFVLDNMVFSSRNVKNGRWWTRATYSFVHRDILHLYSSLMTLIPSAYSIHRSYGVLALWSTYFGGVVAGTYNFGNLKDIQTASMLKNRIVPKKQLSSFWDTYVDVGAEIVAPVLAKLTKVVGANAGCCALVGFDCCSSLEFLWYSLLGCDTSDQTVYDISSHMISFYMGGQMMYTEWEALHNSTSMVDHAGHILGFTAGIISFLFWRSVRKLVGRSKRAGL